MIMLHPALLLILAACVGGFVTRSTRVNAGKFNRNLSLRGGGNSEKNVVTADVCIIGGGLAGLSVACGIARISQDISICVVEKRPEFIKAGATFGLAPNGAKALEELEPGITNELSKLGVPGPSGTIVLPWWEVRDTLYRRVKGYDNIRMIFGEEISEIDANCGDDGGEKVCAVFKSNLNVISKLLVGADGANSQIRTLLNLPPAADYGADVYRGNLNAIEGPPELQKLLSSGNIVPMGMLSEDNTVILAFNFHEILPGRLTWTVSTQRTEYATDDSNKEAVASLFKDWQKYSAMKPTIEALIDATPEEQIQKSRLRIIEMPATHDAEGWSNCNARSAESPSQGRITLIGDAAHAIRPTDGQGGSMAFEDAVILCRKLKDWERLQTALSTKQLVMEYESTRLQRVRIIHDDQRIAGEAVYRNERVPWSDEFRKWVFDGV